MSDQKLRDPKENVLAQVHGDDFVTVRSKTARQCKAKLESRFEIKSQIIGSSVRSPLARLGGRVKTDPDFDAESKEEGVLNRGIRWTEGGREIEPDQRHVDIMVKDLGLEEAKIEYTRRVRSKVRRGGE